MAMETGILRLQSNGAAEALLGLAGLALAHQGHGFHEQRSR